MNLDQAPRAASRTADVPEPVLADLLRRCARREASALSELYVLTSPLVLGCLRRILRRRALADEALQDVYVRVWEAASQYDDYRGRSLAWLVSIARYRAIDILRRERATPVDPAQLVDVLASEEVGTDEVTSSHDTALLDLCMGRLPAEQRESLRLAYADGRSHQDIATTLVKPLGSVKSWIRRGLVSLKECLQSCATPLRN